jgi:hypothetical protein
MLYYYINSIQSNTNLYKIPLLTNDIETEFTEDYTNTFIMSSLITSRDTLYIPKLGYGLTFVWEMYIPSINSNEKWQHSYNIVKPIISMNDSPVIAYHPKKNYLSLNIKYRNNPFYAQYTEVKFNDIKLQKWSKYIIIIENRNIKFYIDGVLTSTKVMPSVIVTYDINSEIVLGQKNNNFLGKIKNLTLYPYPLTYNEINSV